MVCEASQTGTDSVCPRESGRAEQNDYAESDARPQTNPGLRLKLVCGSGHVRLVRPRSQMIHYQRRHSRRRWAMDKKAKKQVLQQIPYGAYIVGTQTDNGKDWLMFGTWLVQTSFKPPLV